MKNFPLAFLLLVSCSPDPTPPPPKVAPEPAGPGAAMMAPPERQSGDLLKYEAPAGWEKQEPTSKLRKAQYKVPDKAKKAGDAELAVFYFGANNDMLADNIKRWASQMGADDPKPETVQGKFKVTLLDLKGTYTGDAEKGPQDNSRLLVAVVEAENGPWYFKLVGPADSVGLW